MKKSLKNILLGFMNLILIFMSITKKKIKVDKNGHEHILFRADVSFTEYFLAVEIDEQNHEDRDLIFEKRTRGIRKKIWLHIY